MVKQKNIIIIFCRIFAIMKKGERFEITFYIIFANTSKKSKEGINYIEIRKVDDNLNDKYEHEVLDQIEVGHKPA